jgi:type III restriction enzyme
MSFEVGEPIQNSPFEEPLRYWYIREGEHPQLIEGSRRAAVVFPPRDQKRAWGEDERILRPSKEYANGFEMVMVNLIRERVAEWKKQGYPGLTRTTLELIEWWTREGRKQNLFFAQLEAALTVIFLKEGRQDFLQGITIPRDEPSEEIKQSDGYTGFERYSCKMATGTGKTTVMGMLAAWSILNKVNSRGDSRFSDTVLVICPNVTIKSRLEELKPERGEASIYRTRDLVPERLMPTLAQGRVIPYNWHIFEPRGIETGGTASKVNKAGVRKKVKTTVLIGRKNTTAYRSRYMTDTFLNAGKAAGTIQVVPGSEVYEAGHLKSVQIEEAKYIESETALVNRVLGKEVGGKRNILVFNDEAHHAYRIRQEEPDEDEEDIFGEPNDAEDEVKEATEWITGLDKIHKLRGINFCVDLSATPYFLARVGRETNKPFPWVVSDFGLIDSIESGLVKVPQLAVRDTTGAEVAKYFNIWRWLVEEKLTAAEKGGSHGSVKPEAVLRFAHTPIAMLGGMWDALSVEWKEKQEDTRPPVFILVCKNTAIAKVIYDWLADDKRPKGIPSSNVAGFRNEGNTINTIRVDSKVVHDTDSESGSAKSDESRWMRFTLDTIGKTDWTYGTQGRPVYPDGFADLAAKLQRPLHPPGRDVRCIVSVGMLTEGWDCNTVTHIIGIRPFMSQLLCEQVVGRGLRRKNYEVNADGRFNEEVAKVLGVPFEVIPFKANATGPTEPLPKRHHVHAIPEKSEFEITFPRVEGYTTAIHRRITMDWANVASLTLEPGKIPPEVELRGLSVNNKGRLTLSGPGKVAAATLTEWRKHQRIQKLVFELSAALTKDYLQNKTCEVPGHVLFKQLVPIVERYIREKVNVVPPADLKDLFLAPYYGWLVEMLESGLRPDVEAGESPEVPIIERNRDAGSTSDVSFWTSRDVRQVSRSHLNYAVADTQNWEQTAAYYIDTHKAVDAFVKNAQLGFAIPYFNNGQNHEYIPDFIIRLKNAQATHLILETKGYDPLEQVKANAANRWVNAVNASGQYGHWAYVICRKPTDVCKAIDTAINPRARL